MKNILNRTQFKSRENPLTNNKIFYNTLNARSNKCKQVKNIPVALDC